MPEASDIVIVSNRLPVHRVSKNGSTTWETSPGGLVSALTPILRDRSSTWIGWAGTAGSAPRPFEHEGTLNVPIRLSRADLTAYYDGFSNRTLWPLYHDGIRTPEYHRKWWWPYVEVNRRFAEAAAEHTSKDGVIWVHDYHLQLVPAMVRELRPDARIGFFLHIPFPPQELFSRLPWRKELLEGLLGSDVVGFQTTFGAQNLVQLCKRYLGIEGSGEELRFDNRTIRAKAFPVSIDVARFEELSRDPSVNARTQAYREQLGKDRRILLGVDRMDYTKGIDIRLRAYQDLLRSDHRDASECVLVQVGVPSRERVAEYQKLRSRVEQLIGQINGEFGELGRTPIHYLHRSLPQDELVALYRAADVMLVTPLRDGMNLIAKEYAATRLDNTGALVLSEFTGSALELDEALLVNPHDIDGLTATMERALSLSVDEQKRRMQALRNVVRANDVYQWAEEFFGALAA